MYIQAVQALYKIRVFNMKIELSEWVGQIFFRIIWTLYKVSASTHVIFFG